MAAPFASGEAALVRSAAPKYTVDKVMTAICQTADKLPGKSVIHFGAIDVLGGLAYAATHR
jgi:subtilisin family serine protease